MKVIDKKKKEWRQNNRKRLFEFDKLNFFFVCSGEGYLCQVKKKKKNRTASFIWKSWGPSGKLCSRLNFLFYSARLNIVLHIISQFFCFFLKNKYPKFLSTYQQGNHHLFWIVFFFFIKQKKKNADYRDEEQPADGGAWAEAWQSSTAIETYN